MFKIANEKSAANSSKWRWARSKVLAGLCWVACFASAALPALALRVTDDRGVKVTFAQSPQRIVSLLPSLTETVCELGQCQRLVGVDRNSNYPASVLALPKTGGGLDPNIEAVVALKPDVVLLSISSRASERLEALGLKVVALEPKTHADVRRVLETVGQLLEVPNAQRVWRVIDASVQAAAQSLPAGVKNTRMYFEVSPAPHGAGEASFIGETLTRLGVKNIVPASMGPFPKLNPEFVVQANPDLIMLGERNALGLAQRPGWGNIRAIREQRICVFSPEESDVLVRPGPRMALGARLMAQCLARQLGGHPAAHLAGEPARDPAKVLR
jgi:iron complex transport system substrate-binding protein